MLIIEREWHPGTCLTVRMTCVPEVMALSAAYPDRIMLRYGPQMLTLAAEANTHLSGLDTVRIDAEAAPELHREADRQGPARFIMAALSNEPQALATASICLIPFADARRHNMLLRTDVAPETPPLTLWTRAFASRIHVPPGILPDGEVGMPFVGEYVTDGRPDTMATLDMTGFDIAAFREGVHRDGGSVWIALAFDRPLRIQRIRLRHGTDDRARWFTGPPRIALASGPVTIATIDPSVQTTWEDIGTLPDYPGPESGDGTFLLVLPEPQLCNGIRIGGTPQSQFLCCAELAGYA